MAATSRSLTGLALGADLAKCLMLAFVVIAAWNGSLDATLLAGCIFSALVVLAVLPQAIRSARMPTFAEGRMSAALFGLAGFVATPAAILLLQGAVEAIGLA